MCEDELKWIDMGNHQSMAKENIMSQTLHRMHSGQGKLLYMRILNLCVNKVSAQIIYDMLLELLILLNQYHTNHL